MPRKWLDELIKNSYIPTLKTIKDTPEGRKEAKRFTREIRQTWARRGLKELSQQQGCMDDLRKAIKLSLGEDHFSLEFVKFTTAEYTRLNDQKQGRVATRNEHIQFITDPDAIVATAVRLLDYPEWSEVAAGLSLLTGRRFAELIATAQFTKKSHWSVIFTGAVKRGKEEGLSFEIPTLTTADKVIAGLKKIRTALPETAGMEAAQINRSYVQPVISAVDKHFAGLIPARDGRDSLYTHGNRAVYATIAVFWYCPASVHETEFKAAIQGHYQIAETKDAELKRSLTASRHYADYAIADSVIAKYEGKRQGIKLGIGGIEPIEAFRKNYAEAQEMTPRAEKKTRSSIHIWQSDKVLLETLCQRLGLTGSQQDRIHQLLNWVTDQIDQTEKKEVSTEPATVSTSIPAPTEAALSPGLEGKIGTLVSTMQQFMELQMSQAVKPAATVKRSTKVASPQEPNDTPKKVQRGSRTETDETIAKAIDAIMAWNNAPDRRHDDKWAITINGIKSFANSQRKITQALEDRAEEIAAHHQQHQIDPAKHNLRHRGQSNIADVITLP